MCDMEPRPHMRREADSQPYRLDLDDGRHGIPHVPTDHACSRQTSVRAPPVASRCSQRARSAMRQVLASNPDTRAAWRRRGADSRGWSRT